MPIFQFILDYAMQSAPKKVKIKIISCMFEYYVIVKLKVLKKMSMNFEWSKRKFSNAFLLYFFSIILRIRT